MRGNGRGGDDPILLLVLNGGRRTATYGAATWWGGGGSDFSNWRWTTTLGWAGLGRSGPRWPGCGWAGFGENKREWGGLLEGFWAKLTMDYRNKVFRFWFKDLDLKPRISNTFKPNLNWGQTKINLNKLFKDFLNLEFLKIGLNIQIQIEA
jgi:hypothetical protein